MNITIEQSSFSSSYLSGPHRLVRLGPHRLNRLFPRLHVRRMTLSFRQKTLSMNRFCSSQVEQSYCKIV